MKPRDEAGKFISPSDVIRYRTIDVWDLREGNVLKTLRDATDNDLDRLREQYDEPWHDIQIEHMED
jgi:hypothetical protein